MTSPAALPAVKASWSFLYVEHARLEQSASAVVLSSHEGTTHVPVSQISTLMLGPGTSVTHEAIKTIARHGCTVVWCGEDGARFYAYGTGGTIWADNLYKQVAAWSCPVRKLEIAKRLYRARFEDTPSQDLTIEQLRGMEGVRVRDTYARYARELGVSWSGRTVKTGDWSTLDPINRALSSANAILYAVCHSAILASGYSPALGFIHTGKQLAFAYDVADLYKSSTTVRAAFETVAVSTDDAERRARTRARELFTSAGLMGRIVWDIHGLFEVAP